MSKMTIKEEGSYNGKIYKIAPTNNVGINGEMVEELFTIGPLGNCCVLLPSSKSMIITINELEILNASTNNISIEEPINIIKISSKGQLNLIYNGDKALTGKVEITKSGVYNLTAPGGYDLKLWHNDREFKLISRNEELTITALELEQLVTITDKLNEHFFATHHVYDCYTEFRDFDKFTNKDLLKVFMSNNGGFNFNAIAGYNHSNFFEINAICKSPKVGDLEIPTDIIISNSELNMCDINFSGENNSNIDQTD